MRVLLVEPPISPFDIPTGIAVLPEPLALETVAAKICEHHEVRLLDMRLEQNLDEILGEFKPHVVGTGSVTANLYLGKQVLQKAKAYNPDILTLIGGHHVTFMPQDAHESYIDVIVIGEGDYNTASVIDAFEKKTSFEPIPNLVINAGECQIRTAEGLLANMDQLPVPARHLVKRYRLQYFQRMHRPIVSINTSRGCPYRCQFCCLWKMNRGKYRVRSAKLVVDEIRNFEENFVDCIDDNSIENVARANQIADLMISGNIRKLMKMYARADTVAKNPELIQKLALAGLKMLLVGFETLRSDKLEEWNKKCTLEINHTAISLLQENGIDVVAYFVVDPQFEEADFERLSHYVSEMKLSDPLFTILVPFPGTDLYEQRKNDIVWNDYRMFDFFHTVMQTKLPLDEFYNQFAMLYQKAYLGNSDSESARAKAAVFSEVFRRISALRTHHDQKASPRSL
ncbi:MAG: radical SAM protein [Chlorobiaceae bacterium]|nr:radical SAM protein [Chlorobiaceae bacterium]